MSIILATEAIQKLKTRTDVKKILVEEFGLEPVSGLRTVNRWIKQNKPNNPLTCKASLLILSRWLLMSEKTLINESNEQGEGLIKRVKTGDKRNNKVTYSRIELETVSDLIKSKKIK